MAAHSLVEMVFVVGLAATLGAAAVPEVLTSVDDIRAAGAARYVSSRLQQIRMEAATRGSSVALRFVKTGSTYTFAVYVDGNGDGVRSRDIQDGTDWPLSPADRLPDRFAGVDFGVLAGLPPVDASSTAPGTDPLRLGSSDMVSFSPLGTATSGSLYVKGRNSLQYVVRVYGDTGRTRILKFDLRTGQWKAV